MLNGANVRILSSKGGCPVWHYRRAESVTPAWRRPWCTDGARPSMSQLRLADVRRASS